MTLPEVDADFSSVRAQLLDTDLPTYYVPNGGNAGDALINVGFYHMAQDLGMDYSVVDRSDWRSIPEDCRIVLGGGGSLVPEWPSSTEFLESVLPRAGQIVILPHSVRDVDRVLTKLRANDVIFCREEYSFAYVSQVGTKARVFLQPDMALYVDPNRLREEAPSRLPNVTLKNIVRLVALRRLAIRSKWHKSLHAFRCDKEANLALQLRRRRVNDVSSLARFGQDTREQTLFSAASFLDALNNYEVVYTDRLHVIIGSALLGKKVFAWPNSYYKVVGVVRFNFSRNGRVRLVERAS